MTDMTGVFIGRVSHVFTIRGRGVGVLFTVSPDHIATRDTLVIVVTRPDGTFVRFAARRGVRSHGTLADWRDGCSDRIGRQTPGHSGRFGYR